MKTIFTLITLVAIALFTNVNAQSQNFNEPGIINTLSQNCWFFYGFYESTTTPIEGARDLYVIPTTSKDNNAQSQSNIGQIATPYLDFAAATTVTFQYRLESILKNNSFRYITVFLYTPTGSQTLTTITLNDNSPLTTQTATIKIPAGKSIQQLVFHFTGASGDGKTGIFFDALSIVGAPYAYNNGCTMRVASTLPLKLVSFSGSQTNNKAQLSWQVAENETGDHFEIERSADGRNFYAASVVFTTDKQGTESYSFRDAKEITANTYYRLKMINKDGTTTSSKIVSIVTNAGASKSLVLLQNPVISDLQFTYQSAVAEVSSVVLYNLSGVKMYSTHIQVQKGSNSFSLPVNNHLSTGTYLMEVANSTGKLVTKMLKK